MRHEVDPALLDAVAAFKEEAGASWKVFVDRRSGGVALAEGQGLPWIPGRGNDLAPAGRPVTVPTRSRAREFWALRQNVRRAVGAARADERARSTSASRNILEPVFQPVGRSGAGRPRRARLFTATGASAPTTGSSSSMPRERRRATKAEAKGRLRRTSEPARKDCSGGESAGSCAGRETRSVIPAISARGGGRAAYRYS